jgi:hypothetical protein
MTTVMRESRDDGITHPTVRTSMPRPVLGLLGSWLFAGCLLAGSSTNAATQQLDYSATYLSGLANFQDEIEGRLIVADTAVFFTQRNGQPIFVLPYSEIRNSYGSPDLYAGREQRKGHYLIVAINRPGDTPAVVFEIAPFVPDTLASAILARLDARRTALYSPRSAAGYLEAYPQQKATQPERRQEGPTKEPAAASEEPSSERTLTAQGERSTLRKQRAPEIEEGIPGYKDGGTATLLSLLITGGGQFYAGEGGAGALYLVGAIAAVGIGAGLSKTECGFYSCSQNLDPLYAGIGVAALFSLISLFDAAPAAGRHNRKLAARRAAQASLSPIVVPRGDRTQVGLNLAFHW